MISVIIPTYGRPERIKRAIESIISQTVDKSEYEIIVIDDNGKRSNFQKETEKELEIFIKNKQIIYLKNEKNMGANKSRNKGVEIAQGKYIAFLDDDDIFYKNKLEVISEIIKENENISLIYSGRVSFSEKTRKKSYSFYDYCKDKKELKKQIIRENFIGSNSFVVVKKNDFLEIGGYDEELESCQDWDLWIRFIYSNKNIIGLNIPLVEYSINYDESRISKNLSKIEQGHNLLFKKINNNFLNIFSDSEKKEILYMQEKFYLELAYKNNDYKKYRKKFIEVYKKYKINYGKKQYLRYLLSFFKLKI